ncbi:sugar phosphate isomerase/epimerase [Photobacterium japonica]|uniref:TIM barrel protein n=1 Tax=Photobacterium japonica TaxID=2910235 RepID=UPI003D0C0DE5
MSYILACAPCCWGVESSDNPHNPDWMKVLTETRLAGYFGTELGPYGFLPLDADVINTALFHKELDVCAGTIFEPLSDPRHYEEIINKTKRLCGLLENIGCEKLVVIDCVNDIRSQFAGMSDRAPRLDAPHWIHMMDTIREISAIAKQHKIRAVVHPHAGGYIEYQDEIDRALHDLPHSDVGLCLDTGHLYYAGMDPAQSLIDYADRLEYVHFKDVNKARLDAAIEQQVGFWQACADGVMCPLGQGAIDYQQVAAALSSIGYHGWITIEQERDPRNADTTLQDIKQSRQFLIESGLAL